MQSVHTLATHNPSGTPFPVQADSLPPVQLEGGPDPLPDPESPESDPPASIPASIPPPDPVPEVDPDPEPDAEPDPECEPDPEPECEPEPEPGCVPSTDASPSGEVTLLPPQPGPKAAMPPSALTVSKTTCPTDFRARCVCLIRDSLSADA